MECEEFIFPDWSPPDNPIQSERAKRASSSIMECEEFILPDWSPPNDPARPCRPKACYGLVMIMMKTVYGWFASPKTRMGKQTRGERPMPQLSRLLLGNHSQY